MLLAGSSYQHLPLHDPELSNDKNFDETDVYAEPSIVSVWKQQFVDALMVPVHTNNNSNSNKITH